MTRININDLAPELAMMICNKFKVERSVNTITANRVSIPIGIDFNPQYDEILVIKNSTVLNEGQFTINKVGTEISPVETKVWEASKRYPVEFDIIVLKAAVPNVSAKVWRGKYTLTTNQSSVPITVYGFNKDADELLVIKNGVVVAPDEYDIVGEAIVAGDHGEWKASTRSPAIFDFVVFKYSTPSSSMALNGYHLLDNTVGLSALDPTIRTAIMQIDALVKRVNFLYDAIKQYGNFELKNHILEHERDLESDTTKVLTSGIDTNTKLLKEFDQINKLANARHLEVLQQLEKLNLINQIDKLLPDGVEDTTDVNTINVKDPNASIENK